MSIQPVHIFYTGGTIGMIWNDERKQWELDPQFQRKLREEYLRGYDVPEWDIFVRERTLDSSNMTPEDWLSIADYIKKKETDFPNRYSGYVILHGTDTMAYTASALTFMIENLSKPVILTGSQVPMSVEENDAVDNVVHSLRLAGPPERPRAPLPPAVYLFFFFKLMLGCRTTKVDTTDWDGFDSPNFPVLVYVDEENEIMVDEEIFAQIPAAMAKGALTIQPFSETAVGVLRLFPGLSPALARNFLLNEQLKGAVLHAYGAGNGPGSLCDIFKAANKASKILVAVSQCMWGSVHFDYATGLGRCDAISGFDMTVEAAVTKLFWLLSKYNYPSEVELIKKEMQRNIKGELTKPSEDEELIPAW